MDNVASAAVKYILTLSDVVALLGSYPVTDPIAANAGKPWVFSEDTFTTVEGTGLVALVCSDDGTYSVAPPLTTPQFHRLAIAIWADPARDTRGNIAESAGATIARGKAVFTTLNFHLHRTTGDSQMWGDMRVSVSQLLTGPKFFSVPDVGQLEDLGSGTSSKPQRGVAYYGITAFGGVGYAS